MPACRRCVLVHVGAMCWCILVPCVGASWCYCYVLVHVGAMCWCMCRCYVLVHVGAMWRGRGVQRAAGTDGDLVLHDDLPAALSEPRRQGHRPSVPHQGQAPMTFSSTLRSGACEARFSAAFVCIHPPVSKAERCGLGCGVNKIGAVK